jgi:hypothetical protein
MFDSLSKIFFYVEDNGVLKKLPNQQVEEYTSRNPSRIYDSLRVAFNFYNFYNISKPNYDLHDKFKDTYNISHSEIDDDDMLA